MVANTELAWLAGLIDGEGCLYARSMRQKGTGAVKAVETRLEIQSVSAPMLDAIASILERLDVSYNRAATHMRPLSTRPIGKIRISRKHDLQLLLKALLPYLVTKRPEAERMLLYLERSCLVPLYRCLPDDFLLGEELRALKRRA